MIQKKEPKAPFIIIVCLDYNLKPTLIIPKVYVGLELNYGLGVSSGDDITSWGLDGGVTGMMRVGFRL